MNFPAPDFAFRMFLAQFGNPEGHKQLAALLENLKLSDEENAQLLPIIKLAYDHFQKTSDSQAGADNSNSSLVDLSAA